MIVAAEVDNAIMTTKMLVNCDDDDGFDFSGNGD